MDHLREHSPRQGKVFFLLLYPRKLLKVEYDLSSDFPLHWFTCTVFSFADVPVAKTGDIYRVSLFFAFSLLEVDAKWRTKIPYLWIRTSLGAEWSYDTYVSAILYCSSE